MNILKLIFILLFAIFSISAQISQLEPEIKNRMVILADMGNEPDEEQQIVHMLMYANEFDIMGLVAVTGKFLNPQSNNPEKQRLYPELFIKIIDGYSKVYPNLLKHANEWPTAEYLRTTVVNGQRGYGSSDVGIGKSSDGSELIVKQLTNNDKRPLYVIVNAGSNTLAQALFDIRASNPQLLNEAIAKLRVFENGAQDDAGAWICKTFPNVHWIRSNYQTYCYGGPSVDGGVDNKGKGNELGPYTWKPYAYNGTGQHQWLLENIIGNHGPFGKYYPIRQFPNGGISFMEGGGTIPFLGLVNKGLYDINHPWWGGWSGRYSRDKKENVWSKHQSVNIDEKKNAPFLLYTEEPDSWIDPEDGTVYENNLFAPVWRWRRAFQNDFMCRMDWCNKPFDAANHNPVAVIGNDTTNAILTMKTKAGKTILLDATASKDPDKDKLIFNWFYYQEAGTYNGKVDIDSENSAKVSIKIPEDATGKEIHIVLELKDDNKIGSMYDYRRIVLNVEI